MACLAASSGSAPAMGAMSLQKPSSRLSRTHWRKALFWPPWNWFCMLIIVVRGSSASVWGKGTEAHSGAFSPSSWMQQDR